MEFNQEPADRPAYRLPEEFEYGLEHCRAEVWEAGVSYLLRGLERLAKGIKVPSLIYSYLGYGLAVARGQVHEGLELCQRALQQEFFEPENYLNLARLYILAENRRKAIDTLNKGLEIDPEHSGLLMLRLELGKRRSPVLPFLSRHHPLNRLLGRIRHDIQSG